MNKTTERFDIINNIIKYNQVYRVDLNANGKKNRDYAQNTSYYSIGDMFKLEITHVKPALLKIVVKDKTFNNIYSEMTSSAQTEVLLKQLDRSLRNTQKRVVISCTTHANIKSALNQQLISMGKIK